MTYLNSNQLKLYNEEGYVAPLDVLTKEEALAAKNEIELIEKEIPNEIPSTVLCSNFPVTPSQTPKFLKVLATTLSESSLIISLCLG